MASEQGMATKQLGPWAVRAELSEADGASRTVAVVWSTGARVLRYGLDGPWYEELSMAPGAVRLGRLQSGAPFLPNHDSSEVAKVLGVVESPTISGGQGRCMVRFVAEGIDPEADMVFAKIRDGVIRNVSVGYRTYELEIVPSADGEPPVYRATDWEPFEVSAVCIGADAGAGFRAHEGPVTCSIRGEKMTAEKNDVKAPESGTEAPAVPAVDAVRSAAVLAERERIEGIHLACRKGGVSDEVAAKLISDGASVADARAAALDALAARTAMQPAEHSISVGDTDEDKTMRCAEAWLLEKAGFGRQLQALQAMAKRGDMLPMHARLFAEAPMDGGNFRGSSLLDMGRDLLERRGAKLRGMSQGEIARRMLTEVPQGIYSQRAGGFAPASDFSVLYENVMHKMLLGAYLLQETTWQKICKTESVPDFRLSNRFRVGSFGTMDRVGEGEEYKNKTLPDGLKTSIDVATYGNIIALSRQAIINDDMAANADLAARFGQGFRLTLEKAFYDLLNANSGLGPTMADSNPFFYASRANVNGTGSALTVAGIDSDRIILRTQKDISNNNYLALVPSVLLVPTVLGAQARRINSAQYDHDSNKLMQPNIVQGLFAEVVESPWLTDQTRRYIFASPGIAPAFVMAFLQGTGEAPYLEQQLGWRVDGIEWKARLDAKCQVFDPKGAVTNAGK